MADEKKTSLSIVIRTVDEATAKINAINARLDAATKPVRDFKKALGDLKEKSGFDAVIGGFKGVGSAIEGLLSKVAVVGGVVGLAVGGLVHLVDEFDDLGKKAARLGVGVDFLAEMRYAAEKTGVPVEALDAGLESLNQNLGQVRAGTGRMAKFLGLVSPALLQQLKGAKDNTVAFDLLAGAMAKITDPAKRAALAQKTLGDSALAPLFAKGPKGIKELRDRYLELAGSQEGATEEAEKTGDAMHDLHAATDGVKAGLVRGLAPALKVIVERLRDWLVGHREDIARWASDIGERLPDAIARVVKWLQDAASTVAGFLDKIGGIKTVLIALAAVSLAPLISAFVTLGAAMLATPFGVILAAIVAATAGVASLINEIEKLQRIMGTSHEIALEDSTTMGETEFRSKHPELEGSRSAGDLANRLAHPNLGPVQRNDLNFGAGAEMWSMLNPPKGMVLPDMRGQARATASAGSMQATLAKVTVDFANAPPGTRVKTDPQSTADVDLSVGYQMLGATP